MLRPAFYVRLGNGWPNRAIEPLDNLYLETGLALLKSLSLLAGCSLLGFALIQLTFTWLT